MDDNVRDVLITGLRNAHALEKQAEDMMQNQARRLDNYPVLKQRVEQHVGETKVQIGRLEQGLERLGTSHSAMKDIGMQFSGNVQTMMHAAASDEVIKNSLASFAFENFEIATYKALITMAERGGEQEIANMCRQSLQEEEAMAQFLDEHLDETVVMYLDSLHSGRSAGQSGAVV